MGIAIPPPFARPRVAPGRRDEDWLGELGSPDSLPHGAQGTVRQDVDIASVATVDRGEASVLRRDLLLPRSGSSLHVGLEGSVGVASVAILGAGEALTLRPDLLLPLSRSSEHADLQGTAGAQHRAERRGGQFVEPAPQEAYAGSVRRGGSLHADMEDMSGAGSLARLHPGEASALRLDPAGPRGGQFAGPASQEPYAGSVRGCLWRCFYHSASRACPRGEGCPFCHCEVCQQETSRQCRDRNMRKRRGRPGR
mmetsp:Transcript_22495/g.57341  ORF Transcript_22495/g.57341 Transcript_22495/m.57341 type:complete len:253 (+) Transcript_22495:3-761(+)